MMSVRWFALAVCLLLPPVVHAVDTDKDGIPDPIDSAPTQEEQYPWLYQITGSASGHYLGESVSDAGDVNGDSYPDVIVGAPQTYTAGAGGYVRVLSGATGATLYTFTGDSGTDYFGHSVSGAGDINKDGYADVMVGAYGDDNNGAESGSVRILSGKTGAVLYNFNGDSAGDQFGSQVRDAGDVNGDSYPDVIVGAPLDDNNGADSGSARIFSGANGAVLYNFSGDSAGDEFGNAVSGAGDVNKDGYADVIIAAYRDDNTGLDTGCVRIYSGKTGAVLYTFNGGTADYFNLGMAVSAAGDVNKDSYPDVIVGALGPDEWYTGSARIYSGANGALLRTFLGDKVEDFFGASVGGAGDINGDGYAEVIVGAYMDYGTYKGYARVFNGADGSILYTFNGAYNNDNFGISVSAAGDINQDGYPDMVVGASGYDTTGVEFGLVRIFSGALFLQRTIDTDSDGEVNTLDLDDDADGILDVSDAYPLDTDNDGLPNTTDRDDDNDGVPDFIDAGPLDSGNSNELTLPLNNAYHGSSVRESVLSQ